MRACARARLPLCALCALIVLYKESILPEGACTLWKYEWLGGEARKKGGREEEEEKEEEEGSELEGEETIHLAKGDKTTGSKSSREGSREGKKK